MSANGKEIERAWILNPKKFSRNRAKWRYLDFEASIEHRIGYVVSNDDGELRVVEKDGMPKPDYFITVKSAGNAERNEFERLMPGWVFDVLWPQTEGKRVYKRRFYIASGIFDEHDDLIKDVMLELDEYTDEDGFNPWLYRLECEFDSVEEASQFKLGIPFEDCAFEVTNDKRFKNRNIALHGLPEGWRDLFYEK